MDFVLFLQHILAVLYSLETKLYKDVTVQQLLGFYFVQFFLDLACTLFENFGDEEIHSVLVDSKIRSEFKLCHFFYLQSPDDSNDLEQPFFASFDRLLDA